MTAKSKINLLNKYNPTKITEKKVRGKIVGVEVPNNFCNVGDELQVLTAKAGAWCVVVAVLNPKNNEKFSIKWNDLEFPEEEDDEEFSLDA